MSLAQRSVVVPHGVHDHVRCEAVVSVELHPLSLRMIESVHLANSVRKGRRVSYSIDTRYISCVHVRFHVLNDANATAVLVTGINESKYCNQRTERLLKECCLNVLVRPSRRERYMDLASGWYRFISISEHDFP